MRSTVYREGAGSIPVYPAAILQGECRWDYILKIWACLDILCRPFAFRRMLAGSTSGLASSILAPSTQILWAGTLADFVANQQNLKF